MNLTIVLGALGPTEILLIIGIVILLFGGKKIPQLMKGIGEGMKEFKKASKADETTTVEKKETV